MRPDAKARAGLIAGLLIAYVTGIYVGLAVPDWVFVPIAAGGMLAAVLVARPARLTLKPRRSTLPDAQPNPQERT